MMALVEKVIYFLKGFHFSILFRETMEIARVFVFVCLQVCVCDDNLKINVGTIFRYMYAEYNFEMV